MFAQSHERTELTGDTAPCTGIVLYDGAFGRHAAQNLFYRLAEKFQNDILFEFSWWPFRYLIDPEVARQAVAAAAKVDLMVLALPDPRQLPAQVKSWLDLWVARRKASDGALVTLTETTNAVEAAAAMEEPYLKMLAHRARLDYLPIVAPRHGDYDLLREDETSIVTPHGAGRPDSRLHSLGWGIDE